MTTFVDRIVKLNRLDNSPDGGPRWMVSLRDCGAYKTGVDAQIAHSIENSEYHDRDVRIELDYKGMIVGIEPVK